MEPRFLTAQQFLITTLVFKIAIMALLAPGFSSAGISGIVGIYTKLK